MRFSFTMLALLATFLFTLSCAQIPRHVVVLNQDSVSAQVPNTYIRTNTHTLTHARMHARTHTYARKHARTHTHTNTHSILLSTMPPHNHSILIVFAPQSPSVPARTFLIKSCNKLQCDTHTHSCHPSTRNHIYPSSSSPHPNPTPS